MKLVIVESPKKARDIAGFFPKSEGWEIQASYGHVRDLPVKELGVDVEGGFRPKYVVAGDDRKKANTKKLGELAKKADEVFLCTDPDREGEAISWHLAKVLRVPKDKLRRATWTEVDRKTVERALASPRAIDEDLAMAQQSRRVLDRLVGYPLSSYLGVVLPQYRGKGSLSAGRVQSAVMKVIADREREILAFVPEEYWAIAADLGRLDTEEGFRARLAFERAGGEMGKIVVRDAERAEAVRAALDAGEYRVSSVQTKPGQRKPPAPFDSSTMTSDASRKLGFKSKYAMELAQALFEGFSIDGEQHGLITYHRTDSVNLSDEAVEALRAHIAGAYGEDRLPAEPNVFKSKVKNAQEAHEAIRPKDMAYPPERVASLLTKDQLALYELIWKRTIACQMKPADVARTEILVDNGPYVLKATGTAIVSKGFLEVYEETADEDRKGEDEDGGLLPAVAEGEGLRQVALLCEKKATTPPGRYTEPQLNDMAKASGIYRPSTFPGMLELVEKREYVDIKGKRFWPTEKGMRVVEALEASVPAVVDIGFTAQVEAALDEISAGERQWDAVVGEFYGPFNETLTGRRQEALAALADPSNPACPDCGGPTIKRFRKGGSDQDFFFSCVRYPDCKGSRNADGSTGFPERERVVLEGRTCPECGAELVKMEGKSKKTGKKYLFYSCENYKKTGCSYTYDPKAATGVPCPKCGKGEMKTLVSKKTKKPFWVCDRGKEKCDGILWDDPREADGKGDG